MCSYHYVSVNKKSTDCSGLRNEMIDIVILGRCPL